jgi:SAM-dependent methyltransferase
MIQNVFLNGEYVKRVPGWHTDDAAWKAKDILRMLERNRISPRTIGEVGCGTGEVLRQLQLKMAPGCIFRGYDIAPQAIALSRSRQNDRLQCRLGDIGKVPDARFDLLLVLDVLEHQENYFSFLREVKALAPYKIFHTVLDLSLKAVLRQNGLMELRRASDDLHFFTKDTVLQALRGEGYRVVDWSYVPRAIYRASGLAKRIRQWPRAMCFALNQDFAVRALGGYSLFVLAQ